MNIFAHIAWLIFASKLLMKLLRGKFLAVKLL